MNNNMTIREMMTAARALKKQGERFTLLGVGPMSKTLLTAALSLAKERDFLLMLIASRNQVDSDEFGHGYVCGWDQDRFVKDVEAAAAAVGFDGLVYLCRDHGGRGSGTRSGPPGCRWKRRWKSACVPINTIWTAASICCTLIPPRTRI